MWIITKAVNDYNQHGDYFVCAFFDKPTMHDLRTALPGYDDEFYKNLLKGGGRLTIEDVWYMLTQMKAGETYS